VIKRVLIFAAAVVFAQTGHAASADERIRLLPYDPNQVAGLSVSPGYAAVVELGADEAIQNVVVGNSAVWQVTADSSGQRIIVKPLAGAMTTNMIVVTDARRYAFLLDSNGGEGRDLFVLRFTYPEKTALAPSPSSPIATYKLRGTKSLFPAAMHDDGKHTTITWSDQTLLPAIFAVGEGGQEGIVNGRMVGRNYVIEGISPKFVLRLGDAQAVASRKKTKVRK
jgi:type IV secretion system protein VirB9